MLDEAQYDRVFDLIFAAAEYASLALNDPISEKLRERDLALI
jgi:hypothetical protein